MGTTKIEWADKVWNPVTGCTPVSEGCAHCYAKRMHERFNKTPFSEIQFFDERLNQPLHLRKPRKIFVCSMGDLFHEDVHFPFIKYVWDIILEARQHTFLILTKRPKRMLDFTQWMAGSDDISTAHWPRNVWLGVSVENQKTADERIPILLQIPAAVRFVSVEPMLGEIDIGQYLFCDGSIKKHCEDPCDGCRRAHGINWVIAGCESGPKRRQCKVEWVRSLRTQCVQAEVPFFLKQMEVDGKVRKMPELDGKVWDQIPEVKL